MGRRRWREKACFDFLFTFFHINTVTLLRGGHSGPRAGPSLSTGISYYKRQYGATPTTCGRALIGWAVDERGQVRPPSALRVTSHQWLRASGKLNPLLKRNSGLAAGGKTHKKKKTKIISPPASCTT